MRPPTNSFRRAAPPEAPRMPAAGPEPLKKLENDLRNALAALKSGEEKKKITEGLDDLAATLVSAGTATPQGGDRGEILVRVVGTHKGGSMVPLPGVTVRVVRADP